MYLCGICNTQSKPGEKATRVVTERRTVTYPAIEKAHKYRDQMGREVVKDDPGGEGIEIVKEVLAHERCAAKARAASA